MSNEFPLAVKWGKPANKIIQSFQNQNLEILETKDFFLYSVDLGKRGQTPADLKIRGD